MSSANAPADIQTPEILTAVLRDLLASVEKPSLDPPLAESDLDAQKFHLVKPTATAPEEYYRTALETAHKNILYEIAVNQDQEHNDDESVVRFANLLDCALICVEIEIADSGLPFTLLEELFDTQTIPQSEALFNYLESRVERLTAGMDCGKGKALILLRLCNELLRRLSKAEDTIFCGRILIFLSKSFPIAERSAVNLRGDFNTENITMFDEIAGITPEGEVSMDVEMGDDERARAGFEERQPPMSTDKLYTVFWSLQHDFADPTRLFVPEKFERFKNGLAATMSKFREADEESVKSSGGIGKGDSGGSGGSAKKHDDKKATNGVAGEKRKREDDEEMKGEGFNPKYLTSRELFELEICDLTFRRNVLVQAMILLEFLLSLTPSAKEKWKTLVAPNRSVQFAFTLNAEDEAWAIKTKNQISTSLQPDQSGRLFMRLINTVLTREQNWVQWKAEGCHPFDKSPLAPAEFLSSKTGAASHCQGARPYPFVMGTPSLSRLWQDTGKHLQIDDLMDEQRRLVPSVESFRDGVDNDLEEMKDAMFPSDIEECQNAIQTKTWKGLRLAAQSQFHLFNKFDDRFDETRNDLKMLEDKAAEETKQRLAHIQALSHPAQPQALVVPQTPSQDSPVQAPTPAPITAATPQTPTQASPAPASAPSPVQPAKPST